MNAFSSGGEKGTGVSGAAIRLIGASRSLNASSAIVATISAPKPAVRVSSCRTSTFDVLRADEQAPRVFRSCRADAFQARDVCERALRVLRVEGPAGEAAARGQPDDDRHRRPHAPALLGGDGDEVVPTAGDEVGELHLGD